MQRFATNRWLRCCLSHDPVIFTLNLLVGGFFSILGGYISAHIAKRNELLNGALAAFLCVGSEIYGIAKGASSYPLFISILFLPISPALSLFGGYLKQKQRQIGDYAEWLVAKCLGCSLTSNSNSGYDAIDDQGIRYQIKARRITLSNKSSQLSAIRGLEKNDFDYLIAILFDQGYALTKALKIPNSVIGKYAKYRKHVNAHILYIRGTILEDLSVEDITNLISSEHAKSTLITD